METATLRAKHFTSAKSIFYPLSLAILNFTVVLIIYFGGKKGGFELMDFLFIALWLLGIGYNIWRWNTTDYDLQDGQLFYRSGFTKGHLPVSSIRKIETNTRGWGNVYAALSFKGLMITYNKWDEIFIAPKAQPEFLESLLVLNPEIQIIEPPTA